MSSLFLGVLGGLATVFLAWAAKTVFLNRQLHLVQPKLFDYSGLGDNGDTKTIEVTVINSGRRAEEQINVQFAPGFRYSVIAANSSGLKVDQEGVLKIERLAPKQEITLIIVAEGGEFKKEHILGLSSRDKVGTIKNSLQEAQATPEQVVIGFILFFALIVPVGYAIGKLVEFTIWPSISDKFFGDGVSEPREIGQGESNQQEAASNEASLDFSVVLGEITHSYGVDKAVANSRLATISIVSVVRDGDAVNVVVRLSNKTKERLSYTISMSTPASHQRNDQFASFDYIESDVLVMPGKEVDIELDDYLPSDFDPQLVIVEGRVDANSEMSWRDIDVQLGRSKEDSAHE